MSGETQNSATESGQITLLGISRTPFEWFALALGPVIYFPFFSRPWEELSPSVVDWPLSPGLRGGGGLAVFPQAMLLPSPSSVRLFCLA